MSSDLLEFSEAPAYTSWVVSDLSRTATEGDFVRGAHAALYLDPDIHVYAIGKTGHLIEYYKAPEPFPWQAFDLSRAVALTQSLVDAAAIHLGKDVSVYSAGESGHLLEFFKVPDP